MKNLLNQNRNSLVILFVLIFIFLSGIFFILKLANPGEKISENTTAALLDSSENKIVDENLTSTTTETKPTTDLIPTDSITTTTNTDTGIDINTKTDNTTTTDNTNTTNNTSNTDNTTTTDNTNNSNNTNTSNINSSTLNTSSGTLNQGSVPVYNNSSSNTTNTYSNNTTPPNTTTNNTDNSKFPDKDNTKNKKSVSKINIVEKINHLIYKIDKLTDIIYTPEIIIIGEITTLTGLTLGTIGVVTGSVAFNFRGLSHLLGRIWSILMYGFGIKKRARPWGTVYDSTTKQPIDPAYVILRDTNGETINTCVTDIDGRYGFLVEPGKYNIGVYKTHFVFPSLKLANKKNDEFYDELYFGEQIEVNKFGQVLIKNIPMDRQNFDWNEYAKNKQKKTKFFHQSDVWVRKITNIFFTIGFMLAGLIVLKDPNSYNLTIFILYILLSLSRIFIIRKHIMGNVVEKVSGNPLSYGVLKIYNSVNGQEITRKILDKIGNYYCLIQNGEYVISIEKKNIDGSYTKVFNSAAIKVTEGFLQKNFKV